MPSVSAEALVLPDSANVERAYQTSVSVTKPAPATAATYTVPGGAYEVIISAFAQFVTDTNVAARQVVIVYFDSNSQAIAEVPAGGTQAASNTINYSWLLGVSAFSAISPPAATSPLAPIVMFPGYKFQFSAGLIQAGDQFSLLALTIVRYPSDALTFRPAPLALAPTPLLA